MGRVMLYIALVCEEEVSNSDIKALLQEMSNLAKKAHCRLYSEVPPLNG